MKTSDYQIYLFDCDYVDFNDEEHHVQAVMMAPSMHEAVEAIEKRLPYCSNLFITEYGDTQFLFMNKTLYNRLRNDEDECGLDYDEEEEEYCVCGEDKWEDYYASHFNPEDRYREDFTRSDSDAEDDEAW